MCIFVFLDIVLGVVMVSGAFILSFILLFCFVNFLYDKICELFGEKVDGHYEITRDELNRVLPDPDKIETLANWIDEKHPNDKNPEVQKDLREWAKNIRTLKAEIIRIDKR